MSKKCCNSNVKLESCGCPTPRMCCGSMAVPTTAYQMVSVPQLVYDNVPASPCGVSNNSGNCFGDNWLLIILLLCCCGGNFGGSCGCDDGCGDFGGSWLIILLLLCCGGNGFGC